MSDTRPALTVRWQELERKGWEFSVPPVPKPAHIHAWKNGVPYYGEIDYPFDAQEEECALKVFEYWQLRDWEMKARDE